MTIIKVPDAPSAVLGRDLISATIHREALKSLTMTELRDLRESMVNLADVSSGLLCQPRYETKGTPLYNAPGEGLDLIHELVSRIADAAEDEAEDRSGLTDPKDIETRAWMLIRARAERGDDFGFVARILTDAQEALSTTSP